MSRSVLTLLIGLLLTPLTQAGEGPSRSEQRFLISLARDTIDLYLRTKKQPEVSPACVTPYLKKPLAVFVTLKTKSDELRGCIGMFEANDPLYRNVMDRAIAAATRDPRFPSVRPGELQNLRLSISILTKPKPLVFTSPDDLLIKLKPNRDGVILRSRYGSSTYLPQVWEQLPEKTMFLSRLCQKHGASPDCWKMKDTKVFVYRAIVFSDKDVQQFKQDWFVSGERFECKGLKQP
ncbi:MAG TPA: AmmeMemoRadiSam system protein A [Myxococcota bacterium]|nr:AmmeMemoRadiSam system protein A [Myxococcota bacterium]